MEEGTEISKFAPPKAEEVLAHLGVSEEAGHVLAHGGGADVHDMLLSTVVLVLAEARLVEFADSFVNCHFLFLISEILISFRGWQFTTAT